MCTDEHHYRLTRKPFLNQKPKTKKRTNEKVKYRCKEKETGRETYMSEHVSERVVGVGGVIAPCKVITGIDERGRHKW